MSYGDHLRHGTQEGMGGYLDPPEYPTHSYSVGSGRKDNPHSLMSLPAAWKADHIKPSIKLKAKTLLDAWHHNRPQLDSPEVQEWIRQVQAHFNGMEGKAIELIHKFYPEFNC